METGQDEHRRVPLEGAAPLRGIVIAGGVDRIGDAGGPRISAFIWGGKVAPTPTLPYGRWKGAA